MGDFFLDLRPSGQRAAKEITDRLKFFPDMSIEYVEEESYLLVLSSSASASTWGPFRSVDGSLFVSMSGRAVFESVFWNEALQFKGNGGLTCRAIGKVYHEEGIDHLCEVLNGNYVVVVIDSKRNELVLITDRWGVMPCFRNSEGIEPVVLSSHPDILAKALGIDTDYDLTSLSEFFITGKVSFPYTYYSRIQSVDYGRAYRFSLQNGVPKYLGSRKYFSFEFNTSRCLNEQALAEELSVAFKKAVNRRLLPIFGKAAVSLSGGLDSRAVLCASDDVSELSALTYYDEENIEVRTAAAIARAVGVKFIPLKRDFEHYGNSAVKGIEISGGMSSLGNNHNLGFREQFRSLGFDNILTGCYCDYLFKSLVLDKRELKALRLETFADFSLESYQKFMWYESSHATNVRERLLSVFGEMEGSLSDLDRLRIAAQRTYPLCYEADNQQRTIPQRVMGFSYPAVDNDLLDLYLRIPPRYRLNRSVYTRMVRNICSKKVLSIIDTNTGTRVGATLLTRIVVQNTNDLLRLVQGRSKIPDGSWPNWEYYRGKSEKAKSLIAMHSRNAQQVLLGLFGKEKLENMTSQYKSIHIKEFLRFLTLKIWLEIQDNSEWGIEGYTNAYRSN